MTAPGERGHSHFHRMIDESINLDEPISDIGVLVNSVTNAGENWELDIDSSNGTFIQFYFEFAVYPRRYP